MKTEDEIVELREKYGASSKPMAAMEANYLDGESTGKHAHSREQLLFAIEGVMLVESAVGAWVVPPNRALWIEAGVAHNVTMSGNVKMRTVYVDSEKFEPLPQTTCVINVSPLLRELIVAATQVPLDYEENSRDGRVMRLLLDEIETCEVLPLHLPMPAEPRISALCHALIDNPADTMTAEQWAARLGISAKTIHRLFLQETGMNFARWRQQARLFSALTRIAHGEKIIDIALCCGYASQSAFSVMFRKHFGCAPSEFYR
jgi:AraC-like DNA-binding protein/mannose-6-phosphate isomerase-like protein (cupin superfamily)